MSRIETGYEIEGYRSVFNGKTVVEVIDCNYINWTSNEANRTFINSIHLNKVTNLSANITNMYKTFEGCTSFVELDAFPSSVITMEDTFQNCTSLKQLPSLPNTVTTMINTFRNCNSMTSAPAIPNSVYTLTSAFQDCVNLKYASNIGNSVTTMSNTFKNCPSLISVGTLPNTLYSMVGTFKNCTNLASPPTIPSQVSILAETFDNCQRMMIAPEIPNSVTNMYYTFKDCTSLRNAPTIPNTPTELPGTFIGCLNLTDAGRIPNLVTSLPSTYQDCISLENMPSIPTSVTDLPCTFKGCVNLRNLVSIPSSVTNMYRTFYGCTGVTQDLIITSQNITNAVECFNATSTLRNVYIPFTNSDHLNTATYNAFIAAGYKEDGSVNGIKLCDVTVANVTVKQTPEDAIVYLNATGYSQGPNTITVKKGTRIDWKVERYGYNELTGSITPNNDQVITVTLSKDNFSATINPTPSDAIVTLTGTGGTQAGNTMIAPYQTNIHYKVEHPDYFTQEGDIELETSISIDVTLIKTHYDITINPTPSDATVTLTCGSTTTTNHTISAPYQGEVHWKVEKEGYNTREGEYTDITHDISENIVLVDPNAEIYIDSNKPITTTWTVPKDGIYEIIAVGAGGGGSTSSVNIKHKKYQHFWHNYYEYEQAVMSASGGSGAMSRTYYKFKAGQVFEYRIGTGGAGKRTTADNAEVLRAGDGQSTYLADLVIAGGGQGGLSKASSGSAVREAGTGGVPTQTGYMSLKEAKNGNKGTTKTNSETAIGAASVYSNYGAGGDAQGTIEGGSGVKNGGNGYLKITRIAADPLFESDHGGSSEQVVVSYTGKYNIILVGAGGGYGYAKAYQGGPYWHSASGGGGAGAEIIGTTTLTAGTYVAVIGTGGGNAGGVNKFNDRGGTGGTTSLSLSNTTLASAEGGTGGGYKGSGTGGNGSTSISALTIKLGNNGSAKGADAWDGGLGANGGVSVYNDSATGYGAGAGGNNNYISKSGYIRIEWVGE